MSVFTSRGQAVEVFTRLFTILLDDQTFSSRLQESQLSLRLIQTKPDFQLHISRDGVSAEDTGTPAVLTIKMSSDTAHALWSGKLLVPFAIATGRVRVRGSVAKMLEFQPLLQPAFDRYPQIAADAGVAA